MEVLARAKEILGDGTFKITPLLWGQLFVISAQVTPFVFVPVAVFLLPDKTNQHSEAFSLFREALEQRGLSLSSEWFQKSGFKADYARTENIAFRSFSRAIGPLERFIEE